MIEFISLRPTRWFALIAALSLVLAISCGSTDNADAPSNPSDQTDRGQSLYTANCAVCHGDNGEGQPFWNTKKADGTLPPPPLNGSGHTWHHGDGTLYKQIALGGDYLDLPGFKSGMPAFEDILTHQEIIDILAYVKSLWIGQEIRGVSILDAQSRVSENDPFPPKQ